MGGYLLSIVISLFSVGLVIGCDKPAPTPIAVPSGDAAVDSPQSLDLHGIARLLPERTTHLASDSLGNLYWIQETDNGRDVMFVLGQDGVAHATRLTSDAILAAAGQKHANGDQDVGGNIQSIALTPDGMVLFYFNGGAGRDTLTCVGQYEPRQESISVVLDAPLLAQRTGMGESLSLARGKLLVPAYLKPGSAPHLWLWIRHSDDSRFFRVELRPPAGGRPDVFRLFDSVRGQEMQTNLSSPAVDLAAGGEKQLLITDLTNAVLWNADEAGKVEQFGSLIGLTMRLSEPRMRPDGSVLMFSAVSDSNIGSRNDANELLINQQAMALHRLAYPVLAVVYDKRVTPIVDAPNMHFPTDVDPAKARISQLLSTADRRTWIGYESNSGQLLKMVLSPRD